MTKPKPGHVSCDSHSGVRGGTRQVTRFRTVSAQFLNPQRRAPRTAFILTSCFILTSQGKKKSGGPFLRGHGLRAVTSAPAPRGAEILGDRDRSLPPTARGHHQKGTEGTLPCSCRRGHGHPEAPQAHSRDV